jgi:leucyl aminopeptidase
MHFDIWTTEITTVAAECLILGVFEEGELTEEARAVDAATGGRIAALLERGDFSGKSGETLLVTDLTGTKATRALLSGLGARKGFTRRAWRRAVSAALAAIARTRITSIALAIARPGSKELDDYYLGRAAAELTGAALYQVNDLKTGKKPKSAALETVLAGPVRRAGAAAARRGLAHGVAVATAMRVQRDLANLPANVCTPTYLAERARAIAKAGSGIKVQVLDEAGIKREKMGCFLAVTRGSEEPPKFIIMEYRHAKSAPTVVLVGKGITFDTGGISLKDPGAMDEMKYDMSGGHRGGRSCGRTAPAAQRRQPRCLVRKHAERARDQAGRYRHQRLRTDRRDPQYRRRGPPRAVRCPALCAPLQPGRDHRCRDADRGLRDCARRASHGCHEQ